MPGPPRPRVAWLKPARPCRPSRPPCRPSRRACRSLRSASPRHHGASCLWYQARPVRPLRPGRQLQLGIYFTGPDIPPLLKVQAGGTAFTCPTPSKAISKVRTDPFFLITDLYIPLQSFATDRSYPTARRAVLQGRAGLRRAAPERTGRTQRSVPILPYLTGRQPPEKAPLSSPTSTTSVKAQGILSPANISVTGRGAHLAQ